MPGKVRLPHYSSLRALACLWLVLAFATGQLSALAQQGGTTRYVYDDNGRLRAVVSPTGEAAVYEYDAAGNFTAIRRLAANALELLDFFPKQGVPGDLVTFIGAGFGTVVNSVSFNGSSAQVVSVNNTMITARVPQAATTGLVTIDTPRGTVITAVPFTIRGVRVDPSTAALFSTVALQFTAVVAVAGADQSVTWSVNEVPGGNDNFGTITASGLYTANQPGVLIVRATSNADESLFGESTVTVLNRELISSTPAPLVSVRRGTPPGDVTGAGVSIQRGVPPGSTTGAAVSVLRGLPPGPISSADVSVTNGPYLSTIAPGSYSRSTTVGITVTGTNFDGATILRCFTTTDGVFDSTITFSGLSVNKGGTVITASITIGGATALGRRIVVVSGPAGTSQLADLGTNTIEIVP